jgi:hypothetical protein
MRCCLIRTSIALFGVFLAYTIFASFLVRYVLFAASRPGCCAEAESR